MPIRSVKEVSQRSSCAKYRTRAQTKIERVEGWHTWRKATAMKEQARNAPLHRTLPCDC